MAPFWFWKGRSVQQTHIVKSGPLCVKRAHLSHLSPVTVSVQSGTFLKRFLLFKSSVCGKKTIPIAGERSGSQSFIDIPSTWNITIHWTFRTADRARHFGDRFCTAKMKHLNMLMTMAGVLLCRLGSQGSCSPVTHAMRQPGPTKIWLDTPRTVRKCLSCPSVLELRGGHPSRKKLLLMKKEQEAAAAAKAAEQGAEPERVEKAVSAAGKDTKKIIKAMKKDRKKGKREEASKQKREQAPFRNWVCAMVLSLVSPSPLPLLHCELFSPASLRIVSRSDLSFLPPNTPHIPTPSPLLSLRTQTFCKL